MVDYLTQTNFNTEIKFLFKNRWVLVSHESQFDMAGSFLTIELFGTSIIIINDGKKLKAFHNICPHRGCILIDKKSGATGDKITCPYHGWQFNLTGEVQKILSKKEITSEDLLKYSLKEISLENQFGFLFVNIDNKTNSKIELFKKYESDFKFYKSIKLRQLGKAYNIVVNSNWKHLVENNLEGYHIPHAHPGLQQLFDERYPLVSNGEYTRTEITLSEKNVKSFSEKLYVGISKKYKSKERELRWVYITWFPGLTFELYGEQLVCFQYYPISTNKTLVSVSYYADSGIDRVDQILSYLNLRIGTKTFAEDRRIVELMQKACVSEYFPEPNFVESKESVLREFYELISNTIG
jgi:phenylpropionate dioxygenase-like ring-hydroxylating dioxygenase large terminal subunit